jgi:hypothetical protein
MTSQLLAVIGSILAIAIGLWKFFTSKAAAKQKRKEEALNEIQQGIKDKDPSEITGGIDNLNNS